MYCNFGKSKVNKYSVPKVFWEKECSSQKVYPQLSCHASSGSHEDLQCLLLHECDNLPQQVCVLPPAP